MIQLSWPESTLFAALVVVSVRLFWLRFGKFGEPCSARRKIPTSAFGRLRAGSGFCLGSDAARQSHPASGLCPVLAHALVFRGFCAFALVTVNDFAEAVCGFRVLVRERAAFGRFYFYFVGGVSRLAVVGIDCRVLAFRRFVVRPKVVGAALVSKSGVIALLIFVLMITYLAILALPEAAPAGAGDVVGPHAGAARFSPVNTAYQTSASGSESRDRFPETQGIRRYPEALGRRRFRTGHGERCHAHRGSPGALLRGMRPLHAALPRVQHGQGAESEGSDSGAAHVSEYRRAGFRDAAPRRAYFRRSRYSSARPAGVANSSARWGSSICR